MRHNIELDMNHCLLLLVLIVTAIGTESRALHSRCIVSAHRTPFSSIGQISLTDGGAQGTLQPAYAPPKSIVTVPASDMEDGASE